MEGYALYDLVRLAQSMRTGRRFLRTELERHCRVLQCEPADAQSYLITALGHIAMHLEYLPMERYLRLAKSCFTTLDEALT